MRVGTVAYMAPECFAADPTVTPKCDIYALAVVLWQLLSRRRPWAGRHDMIIAFEVHVRHNRPQLPADLQAALPAPVQQLLADCWAAVPQSRPSSQEVVSRLNALMDHIGAGELANPSIPPSRQAQSEEQDVCVT